MHKIMLFLKKIMTFFPNCSHENCLGVKMVFSASQLIPFQSQHGIVHYVLLEHNVSESKTLIYSKP